MLPILIDEKMPVERLVEIAPNETWQFCLVAWGKIDEASEEMLAILR